MVVVSSPTGALSASMWSHLSPWEGTIFPFPKGAHRVNLERAKGACVKACAPRLTDSNAYGASPGNQ